MVTPEPSGHATERFEHPNPEEAQEINFKCNFMGLWRSLKKK